MKSLTTFDYPAPLAEKASRASLVQQRNWIARGYLQSPIPPALAGKPRMFSLLGIYECAIYAHGSSAGVSVSILSEAFKRRVTTSGDLGNLCEFIDVDENYFWVITAIGPTQGEFDVGEFEIVKKDDLDAAIERLTVNARVVSAFTVINISTAVRSVDEILAREGSGQQNPGDAVNADAERGSAA
jgi:hypothetical protein